MEFMHTCMRHLILTRAAGGVTPGTRSGMAGKGDIARALWCASGRLVRRTRRSLARLAAVLRDFLLQVFVFLTRDQADLLERRQVLFGLRELVHDQVGLADVLVCAAVARVELQRALIVPEGAIELASIAIGVAERVLDVSIARVAQ